MAEEDLEDYRKAQEEREQRQAEARGKLGDARTHGNEQAGTR